MIALGGAFLAGVFTGIALTFAWCLRAVMHRDGSTLREVLGLEQPGGG